MYLLSFEHISVIERCPFTIQRSLQFQVIFIVFINFGDPYLWGKKLILRYLNCIFKWIIYWNHDLKLCLNEYLIVGYMKTRILYFFVLFFHSLSPLWVSISSISWAIIIPHPPPTKKKIKTRKKNNQVSIFAWF